MASGEQGVCGSPRPESLLIAPVTALRFIDNLLLAGEGPVLRIYDTSKSSRTFQTSSHIFKAANIHGITIGPRVGHISYLVAVYGAKNCCVLRLDTGPVCITIKCVEEFSDWLLAVTWLGSQNNQHLALATAHNCILRWDWSKKTIKETIECQEKCILYSALLVGDHWWNLVCCGGTVFNQVVIWGVPGEMDAADRRKVWHRLAGHQGVIFSITFNHVVGLLCSVSDDRSIRVWKVNTNLVPVTMHNTRHSLITTDIGQVATSVWESAQFTLAHVLYGHAARVWDARYLGDHLVSIGEDSTCCLWDTGGNIVRRFKGHRGKSVWSLAVQESSRLVATGGGDAGIRLWEVGDDREASTPTALSQLTPPLHLFDEAASFHPKVTRLVDKDKVLMMTDAGTLFQYDAKFHRWHIVTSDCAYQSYSVLSVSPGGTTIAIGNIHGSVKLLAKGGCSETRCHEGKVLSLVWLSDDQLLTSGPDGIMILWRVVPDAVGHVTLSSEVTLTLPIARQRWAAVAEILPDHDLLVVGDRVGSIHVYDLRQPATAGHAQSFWKVHGKAGVTDARYHDNHVYSAGRDGEYREYIVKERKLELLHSNKVLKGLEWIARLRFTEEDMYVLGFFNDQLIVQSVATNQTLLVLPCGGGHRAWDFVLDEITGDVTFVYIKAGQVEMCHAQLHRQHTILKSSLHGRQVTDVKLISAISRSDGSTSIVATSSEDTRINLLGLHCCNGLAPEYSILTTLQGHISSVRTLATSPSHRSTQGQGCHSDDEVYQGNTDSVVLFSAGGRAQLKAWRISTSFEKEISEQEPHGMADRKSGSCDHDCPVSVQYEHLATYNLHEKEQRNRKPWRKATFDPSPETRYMSLAAVPFSQIFTSVDQNLHLLATGCSDGFVRIVCFNEARRQFNMMAQSNFHDHCVMKIHLFITKYATYVCSAGTDGCVAFWDLTDIVQRYLDCTQEECCHLAGDLKVEGTTQPCLNKLTLELSTPDLVVQAHQSGVNALDVYAVNDAEYLVATGGDDNCLTVHRLVILDTEIGTRPTLNVLGTGKNMTAHATQINGISIKDEGTLQSVSIDQRLVTWTLSPALELTQKSCRYVHVSDVSQMHTWRIGSEQHTTVTGMGLEYLAS